MSPQPEVGPKDSSLFLFFFPLSAKPFLFNFFFFFWFKAVFHYLLYILKNIYFYLFIWLHRVSVAALEIFLAAAHELLVLAYRI